MLVQDRVEKETHYTGGISEIDLCGNHITSEGVKHLLSIPKQLINKLEMLNLSSNNLDSTSCAALANFIPYVPYLKELDLSSNWSIGQGGAVPLITSLKAHNSLERLMLHSTRIGMDDCQALSELLSSSISLKWLHLIDNIFPPEAVELIISGLHQNNTLKRLAMRGSHFSIQNTISLALVLRTNHTLVDLYLQQCNIDSIGACQLASALHTNDTLKMLHLSHNQIGLKGADAFAETLLINKSLKDLNLNDDSIGEEGTHKLISSLMHNTTVEKLWLPGRYKSFLSSSEVDNRVNFP